VGDHATGLALLGGILAALRLAERTAEFQVVETSLLSNALWGIAGDLSTALIDGRRPTPRGRHDVVNATVNSYPCGDGRWIMLNMPIPSSFDHFCAIAELEHLLEDPRFDTPRARFDNMNDLVAVIDATMATRSSAEWGALFDEANIVWAPVQTLPEVAQDKQARSNDYFVPLHDGSSGGVEHETVAVPIKIANVQVEPSGPAPTVGADTDDVLTDLGYSRSEIDDLRRSGVVG
jgi:crotonobetainyl-CoA:carnitine CoA-transferase CaiB-like acyl-CoA transferase